MRKKCVSKRLLSLLLCLSMFLSLGFTAYGQPNEEEEQQGQILPVGETDRDQGVILPAETEAEEQASFSLEAEPLVIEQAGSSRLVVTVRDPLPGLVSGQTVDGGMIENMYATKLRITYFNGDDGLLTDKDSDQTIPFFVLDHQGAPTHTVDLDTDIELGSTKAFAFPIWAYIYQSTWDTAQAGLYEGEVGFVAFWVGEVNGAEKEVIAARYATPVLAAVLKEDMDYSVVLNQSEGGTLSADKAEARHGDTVTITAVPDAGYTLQEIHVTDWRDREVAVQQTGDNWSFTMPLSYVEVTAVWNAGWPMLQQKIHAAENGSTLRLEQDYTAGAGDTALVVPAGKTLTLDLNGHTLDRNLEEAAENGNAITNQGTLTIRDSGENGTIKGAFNTGSGGAVHNSGTLTVEGGMFTANSAMEAGAIYNAAGAVLTIDGGELRKNTTTTYGGGAVVNYGTMTMSGGSIVYNTAAMNGGGVWTAGTLTMSGGIISGNGAGEHGGGVYFREGAFRISGEPRITGNQEGENHSNVFLLSGNRLTVTGPLGEGAYLRVRAEGNSLPKLITSGLRGNLPGLVDDIFVSDDENLRCQLNADGELILVDAIYDIRIDPDMQGGSVTADKARARSYDTVTLTVTPDEGMKLKDLQYLCDGDVYFSNIPQENGSYSFIMPPADLTVYASFVPDVEEYPLLVGGVRVNAANKDNIFGDSGTPRATYDPETCTLTLNTASIPLNNGASDYIYAENLALVVDSKQALSIDTTENYCRPIYIEHGSLTLRGNITIITTEDEGVEVYGYEEGQGNLTIGGQLTVTAIDEHNPYHPVTADAIRASKDITILPGSTVTARSESNCAIYSNSGTISILGGTSTFTSTSDEALRCKYLQIQGGTVTLEGQEDDYTAGVEEDLTVSGGSLTTRGGKRGLNVGGNMTMSGGTVLATGVSYGISVSGTLQVKYGIERLTGEGSRHAIQADGGIVLEPYILVQEPQGAVLNDDKTEFVQPGSSEKVTRVVLVTDPAAPTHYRVTLDDSIPAGSVTADKTLATANETVTLTVTDLNGGIVFAEYVDHRGQTVTVPDLRQVDENTWAFTMPDADVTVSIKYKADTVYPDGKTGIQMLTLLVNGQAAQEGTDEVYARGGDMITVQIRTESYYNLITLILEYQDSGEQITIQIPVSYNANSGSYSASFSMPGAEATLRVTADTSRPWAALQAQIYAAENGAVITMRKDITAEDGNAALIVPAGKSITLDLAGFTLDRARAEKIAAQEGNVITVKGSLTLIDSSEEKTGLVTGGNHTDSGGGISIDSNGTLTIEGGTISGNSTTTWGGGVYLRQNATLNLKGGVITGNRCVNNGAGIHVSESSLLNVSGDPTVWDNLKGDKTQNVNLASGALIHVTGEIAGAKIGVSTSITPTGDMPVRLTQGLPGKGGAENFSSDNEIYCIRMVDGEAYLSKDCTVTFNPCFEGGSMETRQVSVGGSLSELPVHERTGWVFLGWFEAPAESAFTAGDGTAVTTETVFSENTTVYAHWRLPGDINGDGEVENKDVTCLIRYLKYHDIPAVKANVDTNGDNEPDNKDVTQLIRYIKYHDVTIH